MWRPFRHTYTILVTMLGWTLFRSETFSQATSFFVAMAGFASPSRTHSVAEYWRNELAVVLVLGVLCSTPWVPLLKERFERFMETVSGAIRFSGVLVQECLVTVYLFTLFILCAMLLGAQTYNPFIYFRF